MPGGSWEHVSGVLTSSVLGGPISKYYDLYSNSNNNPTNYSASKIGDLMAELIPTARADYKSTTWNNDWANFPCGTSVVVYRGGGIDPSTYAGIFTFNPNTGAENPAFAFRPVVLSL